MTIQIILTNLTNQIILNTSIQQFRTLDWIWILIFLLVLVLVWALLSSAATNAESEAFDLADRIEQEPVHSTLDDLTRIEGIGPKINSMLNDAGIYTFHQLANTEVPDLENILKSAGLRIANPSTWPQQAGLASEEHWDELTRLQQNLKGGQ